MPQQEETEARGHHIGEETGVENPGDGGVENHDEVYRECTHQNHLERVESDVLPRLKSDPQGLVCKQEETRKWQCYPQDAHVLGVVRRAQQALGDQRRKKNQ